MVLAFSCYLLLLGVLLRLVISVLVLGLLLSPAAPPLAISCSSCILLLSPAPPPIGLVNTMPQDVRIKGNLCENDCMSSNFCAALCMRVQAVGDCGRALSPRETEQVHGSRYSKRAQGTREDMRECTLRYTQAHCGKHSEDGRSLFQHIPLPGAGQSSCFMNGRNPGGPWMAMVRKCAQLCARCATAWPHRPSTNMHERGLVTPRPPGGPTGPQGWRREAVACGSGPAAAACCRSAPRLYTACMSSSLPAHTSVSTVAS